MNIDVETIFKEVPIVNTVPPASASQCGEVLKHLGYQVHEGVVVKGVDFVVRNKDVIYSLLTIDESQLKDEYFGIPVGGGATHLFNTPADRISFIHNVYLYEFDVTSMKTLLKTLVEKLSQKQLYAFHDRQSAIELKRLHARWEGGEVYTVLIYIPISTICGKLTHTKQKI